MRPGRLRKILDRGRQLLMAFDQQDIGGLEGLAKRLWIGGTEWLIAANRRLEPFRDTATDRIQNRVDKSHPQSAPARQNALSHAAMDRSWPYAGCCSIVSSASKLSTSRSIDATASRRPSRL